MSLFMQTLLVAVFVTVVFIGSHTTQMHTFHPVVVGPVVDLIMGNMQTGLAMGITAELMFLAVIFVDTAVPPNPTISTAIMAGITTLGGDGTDLAVATALPVSFVGRMTKAFQNSVINTYLIHRMEKTAERLDTRGIAADNLTSPIAVNVLLYDVPTFLAIYFGASYVQAIIDTVPAKVITGLSVGSSMIGTVGSTLLLGSIKVKRFWPFFLLGFFVVTYLNINMIRIALLAMICVAIYYYFKITDADA